MTLFGLILFIIGLILSLYLHGYGADQIPIQLGETSRKNINIVGFTLMCIGIVLIVLGVL